MELLVSDLAEDEKTGERLNAIVGRTAAVRRILELAGKIAQSDATVLISGESGTGKELVAHTIHRLSSRSFYPFVPVNCAAIPEELLESELFGHVRGAFTGAINARQGRFQLAHRGTLFLDEIGEMSAKLQAKLLRVLQTRDFEPVGSDRSFQADVRVVAATNRDLARAVKEKRFREDLFYRLNVLPIPLPPLRDRREDIRLLIAHFLDVHAAKKGKVVERIEAPALAALESHAWPGNVRELENVIQRIVVLNEDGVIRLGDVLDYVTGRNPGGDEEPCLAALTLPPEGLDLDACLREIENRLIVQALSRARGNKTAAAELLQINRTTLIERLRKRDLGPSARNSGEPFSAGLVVRNVTATDRSLTV
jgi:transcriptional regulator with PAS, ATPase and Fis domain